MTRHQKENDMLRQISPTGKENDTNTRLKRTNNKKTKQVTHIHQISSTLSKKAEQYKDYTARKEQRKRLDRSLAPINSTGSA